MADDARISKESRQSFLSSFGSDVNQFLEASESEDNHPLTDIEITTDLGSSASVVSPCSPMPTLTRSMDGRKEIPFRTKSPILEKDSPSPTSNEDSAITPESPIAGPSAESPIAGPSGETSRTAPDTPLPHSDTPLPVEFKEEEFENESSSSDVTVHQEDSINTEVLMKMAGVENKSSTSGSALTQDSLEGLEGIQGVNEANVLEKFAAAKQQDLLAVAPTHESLLLDKVSFMESSGTALQNNTLMATGASLAELPMEDDEGKNEVVKDVLKEASLADEIDKIVEEALSSEIDRESDRDMFPSDESSSSLRRILNPLESTPILQDRLLDNKTTFDLSPVLNSSSKDSPVLISSSHVEQQIEELKQLSVVQEDERTIEREVERRDDKTSERDIESESDSGNKERTMEYYLAKIKAKAAQKSMELRSSMDTSTKSDTPVPDIDVFVKPKQPKRGKSGSNRGIRKPAKTHPSPKVHPTKNVINSPTSSRGGSTVGARGGRTSLSKSKLSASSPVAAYIKSGISTRGKKVAQPKVASLPKKDFGNTWTFDGSKSLVEAVHVDNDSVAWQELYKRTQAELQMVQEQLASTIEKHKDKMTNIKNAHTQEIHRIKQDMYLIQSKLKSIPAADAPIDEREATLHKQIKELETLLAGHQAENVRLYEETRITKQHLKEEQTRLYLENNQLATDNVSLKQLLENKEASLRQLQQQSQSLTLAAKVTNLPKLVELQKQLDEYKSRELLYEQRISVLSSNKENKKYSDVAVNSSLIDVDKQLGTLIKDHASERDQLYNKLEHLLTENNELLADRALLARREEKIAELQCQIKRLQSESYKKDLVSLATRDSMSEIKDLKRQIAELESALYKRHPDSIAALIAAATPVDHNMKLLEMKQHLDTVKEEYETHIAKLKDTISKDSQLESNKSEQMNRALRDKIARDEEYRQRTENENGRLKEELRGLKDGQIPSGEIKRRMEDLQKHICQQEAELVRLRTRITEEEKRAYNPQEFEGKHVSEWRKENSILQTKVDLMKIEVERQKVTMTGLLTEKDNTLQRLQEEYQIKEEALLKENEASIQRLITENAARHAESLSAKLQNKIETLELQVSHYSTVAKSVPDLQQELSVVKDKEKALAEQLSKAGRELDEAQANAPPTVQQLRTLQYKLVSLEKKHNSKVGELEETVSKLERSNVRVIVADQMIVNKYKEQIIEKNKQIEQFQEELDTIISLCHELQQHGIVLPQMNNIY